jgi:protein-tyrosine kinase
MTQFVSLFPKPTDQMGAPAKSAEGKTTKGPEHATGLETVREEEVNIHKECRLVVYTDPRSPAADRFRYFRIRLREPWEAGKVKTVLITSALPRDGKSTVAINLASALCEHGKKRVLLIEADLHRPTLASLLGLDAGPGLAECLTTGVNPVPFLRRLQPLGWYVLTAGGACVNPTELLHSGVLQDLISSLSPHFDWILIDSPPVIPITDALSVAREVDAILMVVRAGSTPRDLVQRSVALLGRKKLLAVVLNGLESVNRMYSEYGYYDNQSSNAGPNTEAKTLDGIPAKGK